MISLLFTNEIGTLSIETNEQTLIYDYIKNKDVEKIEIIQNKNIARIFIKKESLSEHRHEAVRKPLFGDDINRGPHYFLKIGTSQEFRDRLDEAQENFNFTPKGHLSIPGNKNDLAIVIGVRPNANYYQRAKCVVVNAPMGLISAGHTRYEIRFYSGRYASRENPGLNKQSCNFL